MTFRGRIAASASIAVAVAVVAVSSIAYFAVRGELRSQVDQALEARAFTLRNIKIRATPEGLRVLPPPALGGAGGYTQLVTRNGRAVGANGIAAIPVTERARRVAAGLEPAYMTDASVRGTHVRVITAPLAEGIALQVARPLDEIDRVLARMRWFMVLAAIVGVAIAAGIGYLVSRAALAPVERLTRAAEDIARTRDAATRIEAEGEDELARLG
ncbi:MAG TPA: HAMP domain-containing protein, partial [Actinomycetota bacterium]|nr:HAMP domain-containing protein [Actinomycetota bacterium]